MERFKLMEVGLFFFQRLNKIRTRCDVDFVQNPVVSVGIHYSESLFHQRFHTEFLRFCDGVGPRTMELRQ